jgi:integrase
MVKTLTDRLVAGVRPAGGPFLDVCDKKTLGLTLRVGARTKVWYFAFRNGGPPQRLRLGEYPAMSLADARKEVGEQRRLLDRGLDPAEEQECRERPVETTPVAPVFTFADYVPTYVAFQKGRTKEWADEESKIDRHLLPAWGKLPLRDIKRTHVHELLDTVVGKGLTTGVNRIQALVSRMFTVALDRGLVDAHPAARLIKRFKEAPRDRVITDAELRTLWTGLDAQPGAASDAVRLRLLLAQRGNETFGMRWDELDLERGTWTLPRARTKTKQRQHVVALPKTALALLTRRRKLVEQEEPRVFPGLTMAADEHRALFDIHGGAYEWKDTRRTVATRLAELGFDETVIGRLLNHAKYTIMGRHYNTHQYLDEIKQALTAWDAELQRILANEPKRKTRVLPMRGRS